MGNNYWANRNRRAADAIQEKGEKEMARQLAKLYKKSRDKIMSAYLELYAEILDKVAAGEEVNASTLYQLDKYWKIAAATKEELKKMGESTISSLDAHLSAAHDKIYDIIELPKSAAPFATLNDKGIKAVSNAFTGDKKWSSDIWCPDGKSDIQRVSDAMSRLQKALEDGLTNCVTSGSTTAELKTTLMERFNVSYRQANTLVRTEMSHVRSQAQLSKYKDYGYTKYQFDGRGADEASLECDCQDLDGQIFNLADAQEGVNFPPLHPNCRCDTRAIIDNDD